MINIKYFNTKHKDSLLPFHLNIVFLAVTFTRDVTEADQPQ